MGTLDPELLKLLREIAEAVKELPEAVQGQAFQALVDRHLPAAAPASPTPPAPSVPDEAPGPPEPTDWVNLLAEEADVSAEQVQQLLGRDEEGFYVLTPELGQREAQRTRNIAVLVLWATRLVTKDIYAPQALVYRAHRHLKLPVGNITNSLGREKSIRGVHVSGEKMLQLVGEWRARAAEIVREHAT